jgi:hypothetical protein
MKNISVIALVAILLCYMGFYNGFPLLFSDTGSYLYSGFNNEALLDRPAIYGLMLRHLSLQESLWIVVFFQSFCIALGGFYIFKYFSSRRNFQVPYLIFFLVAIVFTGVSINASQLLPDAFTPVMIMASTVLFIGRNISTTDKIGTLILLWISLIVHHSHYLIFLFFLISFTFYKLYLVIFRQQSFPVKKILIPFSILLLALGTISTINYSFSQRLYLSGGSHVFILSRMINMGIINDYLNCECDKQQYKLCHYKDQFPGDFIWDFENSPLYITGGWSANETEYNSIIQDVLITPKYSKRFITRAAESGFRQFFSFEAGDTPAYEGNEEPYNSLNKYFPFLKKEFYYTRQFANKLDYSFINTTQQILFFASLGLIFILLFTGLVPAGLKQLTICILIFMFANALICGTLSGVVPRYQSRVVWLILIPVFLAITEKGLAYSQLFGENKNNKDVR